jgi:CRP-like cAMP-binding protein
VRSLDDGAVLVEAGRPVAAAYRLNKGVACRTRQTAHHRSILEIYLPGDVIGLDLVLCGDAPNAVVMAAPGAARLLPAAELLPVMASNAAVAFAVAWAANEAQRRIEALAALRRLDGEARVALALIDFYDRLHRRQLLHGLSYSLPLTQAELGDYLGMTAIHVNRVLRRLREQRIAVIEKQLVIIMNHEALARLARGDAVGAPVPP